MKKTISVTYVIGQSLKACPFIWKKEDEMAMA